MSHARALADLHAAIERDPQPELLVQRARLTVAAAQEPPSEDLREQLEWFASPAGQQAVAIGIERALADVDAALAQRDEIEWRLLRGDLLLDGARWDEAEAAFAAVLERPGHLDERRRAQAEVGIALARGGDEALAEAAQDLAALVSEHDAESTIMRAVAHMQEVAAEVEAGTVAHNAALDSPDERARRIAGDIARLHADIPERFGPFDARELDRRARRYYDRTLKALRREGFEFCADVEPLRNTQIGGTPALLRVALSPDRLVAAAIWRLVGPFSTVEAVELESLLDDGSILRTNDLGTLNPYAQPPQLRQLSLPPGTDLGTLVATHAQRVAAAPVGATPLPDLAAVEALQEHERVIKREFHRARGWIDDSELRGLLGASYGELAGPVREELGRLLG